MRQQLCRTHAASTAMHWQGRAAGVAHAHVGRWADNWDVGGNTRTQPSPMATHAPASQVLGMAMGMGMQVHTRRTSPMAMHASASWVLGMSMGMGVQAYTGRITMDFYIIFVMCIKHHGSSPNQRLRDCSPLDSCLQLFCTSACRLDAMCARTPRPPPQTRHHVPHRQRGTPPGSDSPPGWSHVTPLRDQAEPSQQVHEGSGHAMPYRRHGAGHAGNTAQAPCQAIDWAAVSQMPGNLLQRDAVLLGGKMTQPG